MHKDILMLSLLNKIENRTQRLERAHDATQERVRWNRVMQSSGATVAIVVSGRDCDGVRYSGNVSIVEANWKAIDDFINHTIYWADGPTYFDIMTVEQAKQVRYESRDLVMEAFEDGHPHVIYG